MEHLISWGGGVNSTAIIALHLLGELDGKPEVVFADTGCEYPDTYAYIESVGNILTQRGWKVTVLRPQDNPEFYNQSIDGRNLLEYCEDGRFVPAKKWKVCNKMYKVRPINKYCGDRKSMIGICKDEWHRVEKLTPEQIAESLYPLKDYTRDECAWLVGKAGLPAPRQTGCYICPMIKKREWIEMYKKHKDLWNICVDLEDNAKNREILYHHLPLEKQMEKWLDEGATINNTIPRQLDLL